MTPITFCVMGEPLGKARARVTKNSTFTPPRTKAFELATAWEARKEMTDREVVDGPVKLFAVAEFAIPKSWPNWKREAALRGEIAHTSAPDADNVLKAIADALNDVVWRDDSQVVDMGLVKRYGLQPKTVVTVWPLPMATAQTARNPERPHITKRRRAA